MPNRHRRCFSARKNNDLLSDTVLASGTHMKQPKAALSISSKDGTPDAMAASSIFLTKSLKNGHESMPLSPTYKQPNVGASIH